ncbi:MAG: hypothetical protein IT306_20920 [Chloroflexi bacterium]|nr:hypothetical protein [Chloroflexota bacterium]
MRRWLGLPTAALVTLLLCALVAAGGLPADDVPLVLAQGAPFCAPGQPARFVFAIAALKERLGAPMGDPAECEHVDAASGDTVQRTSTGLAYYRPSLTLAIFTNGNTHWALVNGQLMLWRNSSVTPPEPTAAEADYLGKTSTLRARFAALQGRLDAARRQAGAGQLDAVDPASLRSLADDLRATRDAYAAARGSGRLFRYHGLMVTAVNSAMGSAEMLAQARLVQPSDTRTSLLARGATYRQDSEQRQQAAQDAYSQALPVPAN